MPGNRDEAFARDGNSEVSIRGLSCFARVLPPEITWRVPNSSCECPAELLAAGKPATAGDMCDLVGCGEQQLLSSFETLAFDLFTDRPANGLLELIVQPTPAHRSCRNDVLDTDSLMEVLPDEPKSLGNVGIFEGEYIAATADHEPPGCDSLRFEFGRTAFHQQIERTRCLLGVLMTVTVNAGDWNRRELAGVLVVIDTNNRDLFGDANSRFLGDVQKKVGAMVALRENAHRLG